MRGQEVVEIVTVIRLVMDIVKGGWSLLARKRGAARQAPVFALVAIVRRMAKPSTKVGPAGPARLRWRHGNR